MVYNKGIVVWRFGIRVTHWEWSAVVAVTYYTAIPTGYGAKRILFIKV